jgi:inner membrane protein involved in colicin E2 resistance
MESRDLWRILLVSLAGTLPTLIYIRSENFSRRRFILFSAIHLLLTAGAVFGLLIYFEWVHATNAIFTGIIFIVIYIACYIYFDHQEKKLAKALNEKINAFRKGENASDNDEY